MMQSKQKFTATVWVFFCLISTAYSASQGARHDGNWDDSSIWTTGKIPDSTSTVYVAGSAYGSSPAPPGTAFSATVSLTQNQAARNLFLGYNYFTTGALNLNGNKLTLNGIFYFGGAGNATVNEENGSISARSWYIDGVSGFTFGPNDRIWEGLQLSNGSNITTSSTDMFRPLTDSVGITILSGSTLNLGANIDIWRMPLQGGISIRGDGSKLNMNGHDVNVVALHIGSPDGGTVRIERGQTPGSITTRTVYVEGNTFDLIPSDSVSGLQLINGKSTISDGVKLDYLYAAESSSATIASDSSITWYVQVYSGSSVEMDSDINVKTGVQIKDVGSAVHMNGHNIVASSISLGGSSSIDGDPHQVSTLDRGTTPGFLITPSFIVYGGSFDLIPGDQVKGFALSGASTNLRDGVTISSLLILESAATINSSQNVTQDILTRGSVLSLAADLHLSGRLEIEGTGNVINANGFDIGAASLLVNSGGSVVVNNLGSVYLDELDLLGSNVKIHGGVVDEYLRLSEGAVLQVSGINGVGLTLNGELERSDNDNDVLKLDISMPGWIFRWRNDFEYQSRQDELESLIASGRVVISASSGIDYSVYDYGGYTYIGTTTVPEVGSLVFVAIWSIGCFIARGREGICWGPARLWFGRICGACAKIG